MHRCCCCCYCCWFWFSIRRVKLVFCHLKKKYDCSDVCTVGMAWNSNTHRSRPFFDRFSVIFLLYFEPNSNCVPFFDVCFCLFVYLLLSRLPRTTHRFSQSGNLNRHMRVHGTNGNNLITWQRHLLRHSAHGFTRSREFHTSIYESSASVSCAEEFQRLRPEMCSLYKSNFVNIYWNESIYRINCWNHVNLNNTNNWTNPKICSALSVSHQNYVYTVYRRKFRILLSILVGKFSLSFSNKQRARFHIFQNNIRRAPQCRDIEKSSSTLSNVWMFEIVPKNLLNRNWEFYTHGVQKNATNEESTQFLLSKHKSNELDLIKCIKWKQQCVFVCLSMLSLFFLNSSISLSLSQSMEGVI